MRSSLTFLFLIGFVTFAFGQVKRYVKPTATGTGSGLSWANASNNLQAMIDASASGDEVWVASGTYKPTQHPTGCTSCTSNRDFAFSLKAGVKVYGGFTGTETVLGQRYWATNITILSGDIGVLGDNTDNAYHVVVAAFGSSTPTTQIDGFTITGGRADGSGSITINGQNISNNHGGGIYVYGGTNNTISNNTIFGNSSTGRGGGIYATLGSINIITNIISGNSASSGGGILTYNNVNSTFTNNTASGNSATFGGGIYTLGGTNIVTNNTISGNAASSIGGGFYTTGAVSTTITNSIIWGNNSGLVNGTSTPLSVTYSIVQSGFTGCMSCPNTNGNVDPQFISALAPGLNTGGNYNLKPISPAINVGNNAAPGLSGITTDIIGAPRIFNDTVDLGAYELYNGTQNVGIGTHYPGAKLEVAGGVRIADSIYIGGQVRILSGSPGPDKVLTSDASGLASWTNINEQAPGTVAGQMQYWDGTTWINVNPPSGSTKYLGFANGAPTWLPIVGPTDVLNPNTGKVWMDRNLGATQVATSSTDAASYGDLYQWGRRADGHQLRTSGTTSTLSISDIPSHGNFILAPNTPFDWRSPQNPVLWQGVSGTNNPCPTGYRLPTDPEWNAEHLSWSSNNAAGAFASPLKLPVAGYRGLSSGSLFFVGTYGDYWSSTVSGTNARLLNFNSSNANMSTGNRAYGRSVRCLKD